ncbi:MAG: methyltransferase [Saprospiraceae bacterium]|nr:methyltransferase [Saprospiraceae bacterium]
MQCKAPSKLLQGRFRWCFIRCLCNTASSAKILDIGTGTGLLALMAAQKNSNAEITGIEPDEHSYSEAEYNFRNSPWADRLEIFNTSLQEFRLCTLQKYDHIICNPPYFSNSLPPPSDLKKMQDIL